MQKACLIRSCNSVSIQNRMWQYLQIVMLKVTIEKESCDTSKAQKRLREITTKYFQQGPDYTAPNEAQLKYVRNTVAGLEWVKILFKQSYSREHLWNHHQMFTTFDTS